MKRALLGGFTREQISAEKSPLFKIMRSNRPQAEISLKLDSNRRLIDFFDPNLLSKSQSSQQNPIDFLAKRFRSSGL